VYFHCAEKGILIAYLSTQELVLAMQFVRQGLKFEPYVRGSFLLRAGLCHPNL
jgi:hypothetical protein